MEFITSRKWILENEYVGYKGFSMNNDGSKIIVAFKNKTKIYSLDIKYVEDSTSYTIEELHNDVSVPFIQYQL